METTEIIALMLGAASASSINPYTAMPVPAWPGVSGQQSMQPVLEIITNPVISTNTDSMYFALFAIFVTWLLPKPWSASHRRLRGAPVSIAAPLNTSGSREQYLLAAAFHHNGDSPGKPLP